MGKDGMVGSGKSKMLTVCMRRKIPTSSTI